jgi:hypothetical protein
LEQTEVQVVQADSLLLEEQEVEQLGLLQEHPVQAEQVLTV